MRENILLELNTYQACMIIYKYVYLEHVENIAIKMLQIITTNTFSIFYILTFQNNLYQIIYFTLQFIKISIKKERKKERKYIKLSFFTHDYYPRFFPSFLRYIKKWKKKKR